MNKGYRLGRFVYKTANFSKFNRRQHNSTTPEAITML